MRKLTSSLTALVAIAAALLWFRPRTVYELWTLEELPAGPPVSGRIADRVAVADADGDGRRDIWVLSATGTDASGARTVRIYRNLGARDFTVAIRKFERGDTPLLVPDASDRLLNLAGICAPSDLRAHLPPGHRGVLFDADNDGTADVFTFGAERQSARTRLLLGGARRPFTDAANRVHSLLSRPIGVAGATAADLDGDGRVDLVLLLRDGRPRVLWNGFAPRPFLHLRTEPGPRGDAGSRLRLEVVTATGVIREYCLPAGRPAAVHIGLGVATDRVELRALWPGAVQAIFADVTPGRYRLTLTQSGGELSRLDPVPRTPPRSK